MKTLDPITWFEIPAQDLERAMQFYQAVLQWPLKTETMGEMRMAMFPSAADRAGGCLIQEAGYQPSKEGTVVYLTAGPTWKISSASGSRSVERGIVAAIAH